MSVKQKPVCKVTSSSSLGTIRCTCKRRYDAGYVAHEAEDGEQALEIAQKETLTWPYSTS